MELIFNCPFCNQELSIDESAAGSEIQCPSCSEALLVPASEPGEAPRPRGERLLTVPNAGKEGAAKILKPTARPLEVAAKADKKPRLKTFRHHEWTKEGKDQFDDTVSFFLQKVGQDYILGVHTFQYSYTPKDSPAAVTDYGVAVYYRS